jgi:phosphate transport system protein
VRDRFNRKLKELRDDILKMGSMVEDELALAMKSLESLNIEMAQEVIAADIEVNDMRFAIEEKCFELIVTQQPAASDLRAIVAVMNMIVDLERMGDKAKGIAKTIDRLAEYSTRPKRPELAEMGRIVGEMLHHSMTAYATNDMNLAELVANRDGEVDGLYANIFTKTIEKMTDTKKQKKVESTYEMLSCARELERFGDLATNIAERVIYIITGKLNEFNTDLEDAT